jgi:hypothetical protein
MVGEVAPMPCGNYDGVAPRGRWRESPAARGGAQPWSSDNGASCGLRDRPTYRESATRAGLPPVGIDITEGLCAKGFDVHDVRGDGVDGPLWWRATLARQVARQSATSRPPVLA